MYALTGRRDSLWCIESNYCDEEEQKVGRNGGRLIRSAILLGKGSVLNNHFAVVYTMAVAINAIFSTRATTDNHRDFIFRV